MVDQRRSGSWRVVWANPGTGSGSSVVEWPADEFTRARHSVGLDRDGYAIFLDPAGWPDKDLLEFATDGDLAAKALSTQKTYVTEIRVWLDFLHELKDGLDWRDAAVEDLRDYEYWRCRDMDSPDRRARLLDGVTWQKILAAIALLYEWAVYRKIVPTSPVVHRALSVRGHRAGTANRRQGMAEQQPTDVRRSHVRWLTRRAYERWRRIGFEDYDADGCRRGMDRVRSTARNVAFADLAYGTGMRRREIGGLLTIEVPEPDESSSMSSGWVAATLGKGGRGRVFYADRRHLTRVYGYLRAQRYASVRRAQQFGRYDRVPGKLIVAGVRRRGRASSITFVDTSLPSAVPMTVMLNGLDLASRMRLFQETDAGLEPLWLWLREDGLPHPIEGWNVVFAEANKRLMREGIDLWVTPHMLRHSHALHMLCQVQNAYLLRSGMDAAERRQYQALFGNVWELVRDLLGHASVETTKAWYLEPVRGLQLETLLMAQVDSPVCDTDTILRLVSQHSGLVLDVPDDTHAR